MTVARKAPTLGAGRRWSAAATTKLHGTRSAVSNCR